MGDEDACYGLVFCKVVGFWGFFMEMVTLLKQKYSKTETGCRISVLGEAQTWLDRSPRTLSLLDLLWAGCWTGHL